MEGSTFNFFLVRFASGSEEAGCWCNLLLQISISGDIDEMALLCRVIGQGRGDFVAFGRVAEVGFEGLSYDFS